MPLDVCSQVAELTASVAKQREIRTLGVVEYLIPRDLKKPLFAADQALPDGFLSGLPIQRRSEEGPESPWQSHRQGQQPPYRNTAKVSDNPAEVFCLLLHTDSSNGRLPALRMVPRIGRRTRLNGDCQLCSSRERIP
jgi:hypothetical protein